MMKNNKGITLIALVVTIIVLLILAGVSIAMLTGENGILGKASGSAIANAIGEGKDQVALTVADATADFYQTKYVSDSGSVNSTSAKGNATVSNAELVRYVREKVNALGTSVKNVTITCSDTGLVTVQSNDDADKKATATINSNGTISGWSNAY